MAGRRALFGDDADDTLADFTVVQWGEGVTPEPDQNLFANGNRIIGTMIGGEWWYTKEHTPLNDLRYQ
jgi:hypothetical protein